MVATLLLRTARALATAWLITSAVFLLGRSLPGAAPQLFAEDRAISYGTRAEAESTYRQRLGLEQPLFYFRLLPWAWQGTPNQYHTWLAQLAQGHLGASFRDGTAVSRQLGQALRVTLPLTLTALVTSAALALWLALRAARRPFLYKWMHSAAYLLDGTPLFVIGVLLLLLFANPDLWPWFPAYGLGHNAHPFTAAYHLALPVAALTLASWPALFLPLAAALREQWQQPYVVTARAKGTAVGQIGLRHVLPNVLPIFITRLSDLLPSVVAGAVVIEVVFALPGMGRLLAEAAAARDLPVLEGGVLLLAATRLLAWLLADVANKFFDPRLPWS
ncbi:ABC transporter permease [Hymenobacter coalescens]